MAPSALGGSTGLVALPSRCAYSPQALIESSNLSFQTTNPLPSARSLGTCRKSLPSLRSANMIPKSNVVCSTTEEFKQMYQFI